MKHDFAAIEARRWAWSKELFTEATAESGLLKMEEEVREIRADLSIDMPNPEEYADAIMCLFDSAARAGLSVHEVLDAYAEKVRVNIEDRTWKKNADNTYSHVKT
jgi:type II secretory pathway component PulM